MGDVEEPNYGTGHNTEADKIQRNSLYLTFNAPQVDDYHRALFLTHPPIQGQVDSDPRFSGTLFHASYMSPPSDPPTSSPSNFPPSPSDSSFSQKDRHSAVTQRPPTPATSPIWLLEQRAVRDVSTSQSLVLLYRLGTLAETNKSMDEQFSRITTILESIPLGKENRERELGPLKKGQGNAVLHGYDCVIWTSDAVKRLVEEGVLDFDGRDSDDVIAEARALAGPPDAKSMVGVDFGGFKVVN